MERLIELADDAREVLPMFCAPMPAAPVRTANWRPPVLCPQLHCPILQERPSALEFFRDYVSPNKPCVIDNYAASWPAIKLWNSEYLADTMGDAKVNNPDGILYLDFRLSVDAGDVLIPPTRTHFLEL